MNGSYLCYISNAYVLLTVISWIYFEIKRVKDDLSNSGGLWNIINGVFVITVLYYICRCVMKYNYSHTIACYVKCNCVLFAVWKHVFIIVQEALYIQLLHIGLLCFIALFPLTVSLLLTTIIHGCKCM